jgi:hypothetical protein
MAIAADGWTPLLSGQISTYADDRCAAGSLPACAQAGSAGSGPSATTGATRTP